VIATLLNPRAELGDRRLVGVEHDSRGLRDWVRLDRDDAGAAGEHMLDDSLLRPVMQTPDVQDRGLSSGCS
jgi:hypothetical protein